MSKNYTVRTRINRPVADVFNAVTSQEQMKKYFLDGASEDLREGAEIAWRWDHYGENKVLVKKIVENERIEIIIDSIEWEKSKDDAYDVLITFKFEEIDDNTTMLSISEAGWKTDADGLKASHENCEGWTHMTVALKVWLEHGIALNQGVSD